MVALIEQPTIEDIRMAEHTFLWFLKNANNKSRAKAAWWMFSHILNGKLETESRVTKRVEYKKKLEMAHKAYRARIDHFGGGSH